MIFFLLLLFKPSPANLSVLAVRLAPTHPLLTPRVGRQDSAFLPQLSITRQQVWSHCAPGMGASCHLDQAPGPASLPPFPFLPPASTPSPPASLVVSPLTSQVLGASDNFPLRVHVNLGTGTSSQLRPFTWLITCPTPIFSVSATVTFPPGTSKAFEQYPQLCKKDSPLQFSFYLLSPYFLFKTLLG